MTSSNIERPRKYRGRFAPSPSGPLHFGSLVTALASYIHAKQQHGSWLVRIEDIDPPREQKGADKLILQTLEAYGLYWDEPVLYQSQQSDQYLATLALLAQQKLTYACTCTRAKIKAHGGIYQGHCRTNNHNQENAAIRLINNAGISEYNDLIQQHVACNTALANEDFILRRKDGLFAYQLAVVCDDIEQNITHIIRGCDLLEPTARQLTFFNVLQQPTPYFGHVPLAVTEQGFKLSKQNKAPAINNQLPQPTLVNALRFLQQKPPNELVYQPVEKIIEWAIQHFDFSLLANKQEIVLKNQ